MLSLALYETLKGTISQFTGNHLEIGAFDGEGIRSLALAFPNKQFYVIDPFIEDGHTSWISNKNKGESMPHIREIAVANMNLPNIIHYEMTTESFLKSGISLNDIQTILIDGSHNYNVVIIDIDLSLSLLKNKNGLILLDDTNKQEVYDAYLQYFPIESDSRYTVVNNQIQILIYGTF